MAGKQIDINLSVNDSSGSLKKRNEEAKELNRNLSAAARSAEKALRPAARMQPQGEGTEYGRARGSMGTTGASARDFANQAQGLGGLVRVYATVAANLFAVSAAFNALKEAANTTTMIKGLDQLGAASGQALGSLSQRLVQATDNAITLREAMSTVSKASAAGLSSKQIIEIGQYAKTASQALGLDMTDAISRLTRGITKLEPELLDELGLFTKIGPATEAYGRQIGKSALSLTDFERRQAFANAVLEEARQKFGGIQLDSNPYQRLEANVRNLATAGLELINSFLTPLANTLSNSSTALVTALGLIAAKLTGMAIPALAGWRNELVKTAQEAKQRAQQINESFGEKFVQRTTSALKIPDITKELNKVENEFKEATRRFLEEDNNIRQKSRSKIISGLKEEVVTTETISRIKKDITAREGLTDAANMRHVAAQKELLALYNARLQLQQKLNLAESQAEKQFQASNLEEMARLKISQRAGARAERLSILSQVGSNVEAGGFKFAIQELDKGLKQAVDLKGWGALRTKATGWAIAGTQTVGIFLRALGGIGNAILLGIFAFTTLDSILSKNAEQVSEFNAQLKQSDSTLKTATDTWKLYGDNISAASISAQANVFAQLSEDIDMLSNKMEAAVTSGGIWDRFKERIFGMFGMGMADDYAEKTAQLLTEQINKLPEGELRTSVEAKVAKILGTSGISAAEIEAVLAKKSTMEAIKLAREANKAAKEIPTTYKGWQASIDAVDQSMKAADDRLMELTQSLSNTDPVTKFGAAFMQAGFDMKKAFEETKTTIGALDKILAKRRVLGVLGPEIQGELQSIKEVYTAISKEADNYYNQLESQKKVLAALEESRPRGESATREALAAWEQTKKLIQDNVANLQIQFSARQINMRALEQSLDKVVAGAISKGYSLIEGVVSRAMEQANLTVRRNLYQGLSGPGVTAGTSSINLREIELQRENNSILTRLNSTMIKANILKEVELARETIKAAEEKIGKGETLTAVEQNRFERAKTIRDEGEILAGIVAAGKTINQKTIERLPAELAGEAGRYATTTQGARQQDAALQAKRQVELDNRRLGILKEQQDEELRIQQAKVVSINSGQQLLELQQKQYEYLSDSAIQAKQKLETDRQTQEQLLARKALENEVFLINEKLQLANSRGNAEDVKNLTQTRDSKLDQIRILREQQDVETEILTVQQAQFRVQNQYNKELKARQEESAIQQLLRDTEKDRISNQLELLSIRSQIMVMLPDEIANEEKRLKTLQLASEAEDLRVKAFETRNEKLNKLENDRRLIEAAGGKIDKEYYDQAKSRIETFYDYELARITQNNRAKSEALNLQYSMTDRMKNYDQIFRNAFEGMADALVEFTKTGKLNFNSLIETMLQGLLRYELQMQSLMLYQSLRPGMMDFLKGIIPGFGGKTMDTSPTSSFTTDPYVLPGSFAKGGAFIGGVEKFGKGGMFTNTIVTEPTLFKFARGAGLMGEAGPEAIMPLRRDNNGNLGVMAKPQGGNVEVVVNNYSGEKAEARETVDSRGNRKIEVVVGEMVASEVGRKNSPMQQAISGNFMTRPMITRR